MTDSSLAKSKKIVLGQIGRVYGIKGWLKLSSFTSPPANILKYSKFMVKLGDRTELLQIDEFKKQQNGIKVHFLGYDDPEVSQKLVGREVSVERHRLPVLSEEEFYWHELEALEVINLEGHNLGQVAHLIETGANDVLVVKPSDQSLDRRERLIPYIKGSVVKKVDIPSKKIEVDWGADFLD